LIERDGSGAACGYDGWYCAIARQDPLADRIVVHQDKTVNDPYRNRMATFTNGRACQDSAQDNKKASDLSQRNF
jgi:hypothetical protein